MTMLDRMRRHKSWLKWILALVVLAFIVFYIPDFLRRQDTPVSATSHEAVAVVNGHDLTVADFRGRYDQQLRAYRAQLGGNVDEALLRQLRVEQKVLSDMIEEEVAVLEAQRRGIRISDEEVAQEIMSFPVFVENGQFIGEARYRQILQSNTPPLSISEFEEGMRRDLLVRKLRSALTDWMSVSDSELEKAFRERNEKVKLQVVALTADKFRDKVTVTDADIAAYFDAHKTDYRIGEQRKIKYVLLDIQQARLKLVVSPQDVEQYYKQNLSRYQTPEQVRASHILFKTEGKDDAKVRAQAEDVLKQVKAGGDFAALAKKYSEDTSKDNGGDLDYFGRGRMVPEFEKVAFDLKPGETSDLVKSQFGYHIIKVVDHKAGATRPLDEVRMEIQEQLLSEKANEYVVKQASDLGTLKTASDLERAAATASTKVQESDFFTREKPIGGLGPVPEVADRAFTLKDGEVAGPIASPRGPVFIMLSGKKEPYVPMLDEVRERVRQDVTRSKAAELSRARAGEIAKALAGAHDFAAAAKAQGVEAKETQLIARGSVLPDAGVSPEVDKVAFSLPVGGTSDPIATSDGTVIVHVVERSDVKPGDLRKQREAFRAELLEERRSKFFSAYMSKAREGMKITLNPEVVQRVIAANQA
jgi:peptidyl-prolyl cis-trans isomerase D